MKATILIVEDEPAIVDAMQYALEEEDDHIYQISAESS